MPGSGKSLFSNLLKDKGAKVIVMSDVVKKRFSEDGKPGERLMDYAKRLRTIYGNGVVARLSVESMGSPSPLVVFDGVRSLDEVEEFRNLLQGNEIFLVSVHSPPSIRYERIMNRMRPDDSKDISLVKLRDKEELDFGLGGVIAMSDYIITNSSSIAEFKRECEDFIKRVLKFG
ncbi:Dephospho-CoA kinase [Sulfuracidifex tepidarius]|uniref:Dephospho-CoA kinase n=2 Tax=Sulfuracidifex tepidarius TaxID=1294262 RepID=A0A510DU68_9CREN|nr:Dephospho-CoA kinase [Sulfuracidifex tepidarius]BBG26325.1 Dephospho-CoA kinase [Sulfuracidifex tepidarius]